MSLVVVWAAGRPDPITRNGARDAARRELSKAIYHRNDDPWAVRLFNAIQRWIEHLLRSAAHHAPGGGPGALALALVAIALIALVWWRVGLVRRTTSVAGPVLATRGQSSGDLLRAAEAAAGAGEWEAAVVARMRALAMGAEERQLVDARPGRTADELAHEIAAALPGSGPAMRDAAVAFDAVAYGKRPATQQTYQTIVAAAQLLDGKQRGRVLQGAGAS